MTVRLPAAPAPWRLGLDLATGRAPPQGPAGGAWCAALPLTGSRTPPGAGPSPAPAPRGHCAAGRPARQGAGRHRAGRLLCLPGPPLDAAVPPAARPGTVCCRCRPGTRTPAWARAGRPAPPLYHGGTAPRAERAGHRVTAGGGSRGIPGSRRCAGVPYRRTGPRHGTSGAAGPFPTPGTRPVTAPTAREALRTRSAGYAAPGREGGAYSCSSRG